MWPLLILMSPLYPYYFVWKHSFNIGQYFTMNLTGIQTSKRIRSNESSSNDTIEIQSNDGIWQPKMDYIISVVIAGGVYYQSQSIISFSFLDEIAKVSSKQQEQHQQRQHPYQSKAVIDLQKKWHQVWPRLMRVMLRGSVSACIAGMIHPLTTKLIN